MGKSLQIFLSMMLANFKDGTAFCPLSNPQVRVPKSRAGSILARNFFSVPDSLATRVGYNTFARGNILVTGVALSLAQYIVKDLLITCQTKT